MPGRFATVKVPHYPKSWKLAGDVLVTGMWLWVLFMCKEKGPYTFVSPMLAAILRRWWAQSAAEGAWERHQAALDGQACVDERSSQGGALLPLAVLASLKRPLLCGAARRCVSHADSAPRLWSAASAPGGGELGRDSACFCCCNALPRALALPLPAQGLRDPFADHATPTDYIQYHEKVWSQAPVDYVPEQHVAPDGAAVRGARA